MRNDGPPHRGLGLIVVTGDIHDPRRATATRPFGGDVVRLLDGSDRFGMKGAQAGNLGMFSGPTRELNNDEEDSASVTFNYSAHRSSGGVSCSGGPATFSTDLSEIRPTDEVATVHCWRWYQTWIAGRHTKHRDDQYGRVMEHVGANQGQGFVCEVRVWEWLAVRR